MSHSTLDIGDISTLTYVITHVFCPLQPPSEDDHSIRKDESLAGAVVAAAHLYNVHIDQADIRQWRTISAMLENLLAAVRSKSLGIAQTTSQLISMDVGDVLTFLIGAQNAGIVFRKQKDVTIFEAFEVSPRAEAVMMTEGKAICSFPGPALEVPNQIFDDHRFISELVNFLVRMHEDSAAHSDDSGHITQLLTGILRALGRPADVVRISKRVDDDVLSGEGRYRKWRRSSLWLLIRIVLQTTVVRLSLRHSTYKEFMLFFMCCLAKEQLCGDFPNDLLHFISAKISRRLRKLDSSAPDWLSLTVLETCTSLRATIEGRWKQVQTTQRLSPSWSPPSQLDLTRDIQLSLKSSGNYLRKSLLSESTTHPRITFSPQHPPRASLDDLLSSHGKLFEEHYLIEPDIALWDVERAVEQNIDGWVGRVTNNVEACENLEVLAHKYSSSALKTYKNNPELLSVMLLTTIELWVALDQIAVKEIPILADYSPEIPTSLLENLLICKNASRHRLRRVYQYISRRQARLSVFSSMITTDSFAIRFFSTSGRLHGLKAQIEEDARQEVRKKVAELQEKNARFAEFQRNIGKKVRIEKDVEVWMEAYEWPLPANKLEAEVVVFELDCPVPFNMWRAATFHLLVNLCSPPVQQSKGPKIKLVDHTPLQRYHVKHPRSRVSLGSDTRTSVVLSSYMRIPGDKGQVCVDNELKFFEFDTQIGIPVPAALGRSDSSAFCTHQLQSGPYSALQKYVDSTSHTSNEVVANQADCHEDLSMHEYMAFGHLRSGGLLQWLNILRELRSRSLSFRRQEVHMLLVQTVSQVGPLVDRGWIWHKEIFQPNFCHALLGELRNLVQDVEANWLEAVTMDTVSVLLRRILETGPNHPVSLETLDLLRIVRRKVFSWIQELSAELVKAPGNEGFRGVLRDAAAICRSTFDVDPSIISKVLRSPEDVEILLSSTIIIYDHMPNDVSRLPAYSQLLLDRDRRLSLALEGALSDLIRTDSTDQGINLAVRRIWPDYHPGSKWAPLLVPNSRWFSCTTAPAANQPPQTMYLNILDGSLLADGKPLGTGLPRGYVQHALYIQLFGNRMVEVLPADLPEMDYSTRGMISNHRVYFSLRNIGSDLVIRAKRKTMDTGDSEVIELIPHEKLKGDLPAVLIDGHSHWLNLSTSIMEICPLDNPWETSADNWRVDCTLGRYRMWRRHEFLIDVRSHSWDAVSKLLQPLGTPEDLVISVSPVDSGQFQSPLRLAIHLPCYDLSFYVDEDGDLQSRNIRGMVYDENQSIETLFGLANQLVLRPKTRDASVAELSPRCVLIPDGKVSFRKEGHHVRVEINASHSPLGRIAYQAYRVDTDLGCLIGNSSLTSKLYCAYLHALTSGCSTDPLTGRSGTEEALSILRSASRSSNPSFGPRDAELLSLITALCPLRTWNTEKSVEQVEWHDIPAMSQNQEFYFLSKEIKERYERVQQFHESQSGPSLEKLPSQIEHLLKRSARRVAYLFPLGFSVRSFEPNADVNYRSRTWDSSGEHRAYIAASCVYHRNAMRTNDVWNIVQSWWKEVYGEAVWSLRYNKSWLSPDLSVVWLKTYNLLRTSGEEKWFQLLFSLPAMAYASKNLSDLVRVFVAFALNSQFCLENPPHYDSYPVPLGCAPSLVLLKNYVVGCAQPFERSPESLEPANFRESPDDLEKRQREMYDTRRHADGEATAQMLLKAWPSETGPTCSLDPDLYNVTDLDSKVHRHFSDCFRNLKLQEHLTRVQVILNTLGSADPLIFTPRYSFNPPRTVPTRIPWALTVDQLFTRPAPSVRIYDRLPRYTPCIGNRSLSDAAPLHRLIAKVDASAETSFQREYASNLRNSAESFGSETSFAVLEEMKPPTVGTLIDHYTRCKANYIEALLHLRHYLGPKDKSEQAIEHSGQWPRITPYALFPYLASNSPIALSSEWKWYLVSIILLVLELQRSRRSLLLYYNGLHEEFWQELQNEGCGGWNAESLPDWLLIQLQGNFLIRRVQAEVANEMISPRSGENTAMQLNMGEGKTSVIVPIIAAVLANGEQLVRVIVPKPLVVQTLHILADRLGGLTNRRIYYLPFSRSLTLNGERLASLREIMLECVQERGILVLQPEHVLSLKLVSVEKQLAQAEGDQLANLLLELQKWLHSHSRDILDENDEILDVRSQLVFTIGLQQHVEGSPERWTTTQQVLGLVSKHAFALERQFPLGVEYKRAPPGSFPYLRILQAEAGQQLVSWIIQDIIDGLLPNINAGQLYPYSDLRYNIRGFISCEDIPLTHIQLLKEQFGKTPLWGGLLLLRGLLANHLLLFALQERRWRVDYGLAPSRTMLAVPYRAKDVPAQRAEFGHPDVAIILTCLSYYYGGLSEEQLRRCFNILLKQQDPYSDYDFWIRDLSDVMPETLQILSNVNIESEEQWSKFLYPLFSRNLSTINFYLSRVVFSGEAKEFPSKLSTSGWDLAEKKGRVLTGFSGTNDGQHLLPRHIAQRDPAHQRGTNAKVLSYLLQPENGHYMCLARRNGAQPTTHEFLRVLVEQKPDIRVLLDVGAQMLDLRNHELAEAWLSINLDASAAIYFSENDELMVRTRDGGVQLLRTSSFSQQLDRCVVYLDDAHTRGTDIKFPSGFRAAVTLGPKITKDRLVQGCMRMRKLGHGHSVVFFAPPEVDRRIRSVVGKGSSDRIETMDILYWAIRETWENIQWWAPHWAKQGIEHTSRYNAWSAFCEGKLTLKELLDKWVQREAKKLAELYLPRNPSDTTLFNNSDLSQRCIELGVQSLDSVDVDEEQERELVHEIGYERQVQRPSRAEPMEHSIHPDVVDFVKTGVLSPWTIFSRKKSDAFKLAFETLDLTSAATNEAYVWSHSILATKDFEETVKASGKMDDYLRPVHWVVSAKRGLNHVLVILSPYEVAHLISNIRSSKQIHLHSYTPHIIKLARPCDDLSLYTIPPVIDKWTPLPDFMDQLNVFAGQLYLNDYKTYIRLCRFLGVYARDLQREYEIEVEADGFILPKNRHLHCLGIWLAHTFESSPVVTLRALMYIRSKGMDFSLTPMGKLLGGELLSEADFGGRDRRFVTETRVKRRLR